MAQAFHIGPAVQLSVLIDGSEFAVIQVVDVTGRFLRSLQCASPEELIVEVRESFDLTHSDMDHFLEALRARRAFGPVWANEKTPAEKPED